MNKPRYIRGNDHIFCIVIRYFFKAVKYVVFLSVFALCIAAGVLAAKAYPIVKGWYEDSARIAASSKPEDFRNEETSYIYADDGSVLLKLKQDKDVDYVKYEDLPKSVMNAFVAIEDKRFYQHCGVDWASTAKACILLVANDGEITRGGSTITQQLVKNVYLSFETSYERKAREIFLALDLEKKYTKNQILEFYINNINFGNGYCGIGAAARGYFDKDVSELSVEEVAFLCAIPNNPSYYNPRTNFDHTICRRNLILREMESQGYLTESQYLQACNAACHLVEQKQEYNDFAASYALECSVREIMRLSGFEFRYDFDSADDYEIYRDKYADAYNEAKIKLTTGGYSIETSINLDAQSALQKVLDDQLASDTEVNDDGTYRIQGAATAIDNSTGRVIASIGGRSGNTNAYLVLNRAFQSYKQPGSTIKPLVVYTPAMMTGYTPDSVLVDEPIEGGPRNADGNYQGDISLRAAVEKSKNTVAWKLFNEITPKKGLSFIQAMHFAKIVPDDFYLPSALGGLTYGTTTEEMAGAYCTLENGGEWREPTCIVSIKDANGNELYEGQQTASIYTEDATKQMTSVLEGVPICGTARGLALDGGHEIACKTGTTNDNKAAWLCGYTHYYSLAVYVAADDNSVSLTAAQGSALPRQIWKGMQEYLLRGKEPVKLLSDVTTESSAEEPDEASVEDSSGSDTSSQRRYDADYSEGVVQNSGDAGNSSESNVNMIDAGQPTDYKPAEEITAPEPKDEQAADEPEVAAPDTPPETPSVQPDGVTLPEETKPSDDDVTQDTLNENEQSESEQ